MNSFSVKVNPSANKMSAVNAIQCVTEIIAERDNNYIRVFSMEWPS